MRTKLAAHIKGMLASSFFMNAFYLMLSTVLVAAFGFIFWVLVTRTYDASAVGIATTLLSLSGLLSLLGLAGFDTALVRFLPRAQNKAAYISSAMVVVAGASFLLSVVVAIILPLIVPNLAVLQQGSGWLIFAGITMVTSINTLVNALFLAHKQGRYILALNIVLSVTKVALPLLIAQGSAMTIFVLAGLAQCAALVFGLVKLRRAYGYAFNLHMDRGVLRLVRKFSSATYIASVLNLLPPTLLPLIIVAQLGPSHAAYYYMAFTIASVLYTIAYASMQSVFAEGSHNRAELRRFVRKASQLIGVLLVPAALATALLSTALLSVFGHDYATESDELLQLFALGALPVATYSALGAIFKVTKKLAGIIAMNIAYALVIISASVILLPYLGLNGIGWAWLAGNMAASIVGASFMFEKLIKRGGQNAKVTSTRRGR